VAIIKQELGGFSLFTSDFRIELIHALPPDYRHKSFTYSYHKGVTALPWDLYTISDRKAKGLEGVTRGLRTVCSLKEEEIFLKVLFWGGLMPDSVQFLN